MPLARRRQWKKKALDTLVLSAAGRGVVQAAAHERCVLVQCTIHKNLRFKNQSLAGFCVGSWSWAAPEVIFGSEIQIASPASVDGQHSTHPCFQQQVAVWSRPQRMSAASWYSAPSTKTCASRSQSLAGFCVDSWSWAAPEVILGSGR